MSCLIVLLICLKTDSLFSVVFSIITPVKLLAMIKRLHTTGYEHARPYFDRAISESIIEPNMAPGFHWQHDIEEV